MDQSTNENPFFTKITIWNISIPIFIEFFLTFSVFFTDTFFLSRISQLAAASVGSIIPVFMIFVILFMMMAQGGGSIAAQFLGKGDLPKAKDAYMTTIVINALLGLAVAIIFSLCAENFTSLLGFSGDAKNYATIYLIYISPALFFIAAKTAYNAILASQGKTIWNMYTAVIINGVNILSNIIFLYGLFGLPKIGIYGVIVSTVISQIVAIIFLLNVVHRKFKINFVYENFTYRFKQLIKPILEISIPSSIDPISSEIGAMVIASLGVYLGVTAMAARTYTMNLMILGMCWAAAIAIGNQIMVAHRVGAKLFDSANAQLKSTMKIGVIGSFLIALSVYLFAPILFGLFTVDESVIKLGTQLLLLGLLIEPARAMSSISGYALKGTGDAKVPTMFGIASTWIVAIPTAYYLGIHLHLGFVAVWSALLIDELLRSIINVSRWFTYRWKNTGINARKESESLPQEGGLISEL